VGPGGFNIGLALLRVCLRSDERQGETIEEGGLKEIRPGKINEQPGTVFCPSITLSRVAVSCSFCIRRHGRQKKPGRGKKTQKTPHVIRKGESPDLCRKKKGGPSSGKGHCPTPRPPYSYLTLHPRWPQKEGGGKLKRGERWRGKGENLRYATERRERPLVCPD